MIAAALVTLAVAVVSAFVPAVPIEPYLVGAAVTTGQSAVVLGLAAGIGQTAGKVLMLLGVRGTVRSAALRRWLNRRFSRLVPTGVDGPVPTGVDGPVPTGVDGPVTAADPEPGRPGVGGRGRMAAVLRRWSVALTRTLNRPVVALPVLLLSAAIGMPPLLLVVFYVAATRMPVIVFATVCLVGRSARFIAIALVPELAGLT